MDGHGDGGFRGTVGEEEAIFIGDGDGVGMAEGWGRLLKLISWQLCILVHAFQCKFNR